MVLMGFEPTTFPPGFRSTAFRGSVSLESFHLVIRSRPNLFSFPFLNFLLTCLPCSQIHWVSPFNRYHEHSLSFFFVLAELHLSIWLHVFQVRKVRNNSVWRCKRRFNLFTVPSCYNSGLKDERMRLQTV